MQWKNIVIHFIYNIATTTVVLFVESLMQNAD